MGSTITVDRLVEECLSFFIMLVLHRGRKLRDEYVLVCSSRDVSNDADIYRYLTGGAVAT